MRILNLVLVALLAIETLSWRIPELQNLKDKVKYKIEEEKKNLLNFGKKWVVLVASSEGWNNYRHQADILHAYHIIKTNGIPKENIITMMVNDIANHFRNPMPGKVINKPNGTNLYEGVEIDYSGLDVNSNNFLNIITGNKTAMKSIGSGKVVNLGFFDNIFIFIVDHGATGLIAFPDDLLFADDLINALNSLELNNSFRKVLLYIEACASGSMFDGLLGDNTNVLAVTASGPRENSFGCYCGRQAGKHKTCLGDLFSTTWMENLDATACDLSAKKRTVFNNFSEVRTNVTSSNVMIYGDFKVGHWRLSDFIGHQHSSSCKKTELTSITNEQKIIMSNRNMLKDNILHNLSDDNFTDSEKNKLKMELHNNENLRKVVDNVFNNIYLSVVNEIPEIMNQIGDFDQPKYLKLTLDMFPCYKSILNHITESCFSLPNNPYTLDRLRIFANLCIAEKQIHQKVKYFISKTCSNIQENIINVF